MKKPKFHSKYGIYIIICQENLKFYIGSSNNLPSRFSEHNSTLVRNCHRNIRLQRAWNKYGSDKFIFGILQYCNNENELFPTEQNYLDKFRPYEKHIGFNIAKYVEGSRGLIPSQATREKIRQAQTGRIKSQETVEKLKLAWVENYDKWREQSIALRGVSFELVSPTGELVKICGLKKFAKIHNLDPAQLTRVIKGKDKTIQGWRLPPKLPTKTISLRDPFGKVHEISPEQYIEFCQKSGLDDRRVCDVASGNREHYKGWCLPERLDLYLTLVSPEGKEVMICKYNRAPFCKSIGMDPTNICNMIYGKQLICKGWRLKSENVCP